MAAFQRSSPDGPPNPRARRRRSERRRGAPQVSAVWYVLGFLLVAAVMQGVFYSLQTGRAIDYSEFKSLVRSGKVQEVVVATERIRGTLKQADSEGRQNFVAVPIEDPKLIEDLERYGVRYSGELTSRWMGELLGWIIPLLFIIGLWTIFFRRMSGAEGGVMSFARSRAKVYAEDDVKVSFADVAGVDEAENELREIVEFLKTPKKYTNIGGRIPKGVLLVGPPGTGKTLLAKAVAGEAKVPFFSLKGSEFVEMFVGVGAARVRDLFNQAEAKAPCIVFIDELDALGKVRVQSPLGSHEEREQTLNQLLAEMDGFDSRKGVIIMGATNRPEVLDPALLRPGRFDRQVLVDKPDVRGREEILRIHANSVKIAPDVDLKVVAARTAGFAGADLANLVNEAALLAARKDKTAVDRADFDEAIDRLIAGLEKKRVMSAKERRIVAYHESGHAIVASVLPGPRSGAQDLDRPARVRRARLHDAAAARGSVPADANRPVEPAIGPARRPHRRRDRVRRDLDRRAERPSARHRHRPGDGHRVRDERHARGHQLRRPQARGVPGHADPERARSALRGHRAADRRRSEADHDRSPRPGAPRAAGAPVVARRPCRAPPRKRSHRGGRAPRDAQHVAQALRPAT